MPKETDLERARRKVMEKSKTSTDTELLREKRIKDADKAQKKAQKKIVKALEDENATLFERQKFLDKLEAASDPKAFKIRKQADKPNDATYVMLASDWHLGERVRPENVGRRNEYNPDIAQERAEHYFRSNLKILNIVRHGWNIDRAILWLGGDLITGYIHEEYLEENFLSPTEESLLAYKVLVSGIDYLLAESDLEQIFIPTSNGNHGRTGQRIKIATYAKNSFEWMLYHFLDSHYADEPRVKFQIANGYNNVVDIYGLRANFSHGDAVRGGGGVGGIAIPILKRIGRMAMGIPPEWEGTSKAAPHLDISGHHHQTLNLGTFIKNGSLIGWNDFAEFIGCPYEPPRQTSFVVDSRYKSVSNYNPIFVDKKGSGK